MRRHGEAVARRTGARLAAVEAQAERIAGEVERLLRQQANIEGSMVEKVLGEPEEEDAA